MKFEIKYPTCIYVNNALTKLFIRQDILSKGFHISHHEYMDYNNMQSRLGLHLLKVEFPKIFDSNLINLNNFYINISFEDPYLWKKLPGIAAFGYTQGSLIHELRRGNNQLKENVAQIAAIFNVCISIFDYIIDELSDGEELFEIIDQSFLADLMDISKELSFKNIFTKVDSNDTRKQLLLMFVITFGLTCRRLYQFNRNEEAWNKLSASIFQLYRAEKNTSDLRLKKTFSRDQWLDALKCKSVLPSMTHSLISQIAFDSGSIQAEKNIEELCDIIGHIFWIIDDLADISKDLKNGIPSYVTLKATNIHPSQNNFSEKLNLWEALDATIEDLFALLKRLDDKMNSLSIPNNLYYKVMNFVKMYINGWLK